MGFYRLDTERMMKISGKALVSIDFEGLRILDYTAGLETSSSMAEVTVPPGARHRKARSTRSDKYYYTISGQVEFKVDGKVLGLETGDVCIVPKGQRFSYQNREEETARLLLIHTPSFDPDSEVFEE
jgi:mannose-6-phosphate isomerase-like protein (cupin superfamily)